MAQIPSEHDGIDATVLVEGLSQFYKLQQMIGSYPDNHPVLEAALVSADAGLRRALGDDGSCCVSVGTGFLLVDGARQEVSGELADWADTLKALDIASVRFESCLDRRSILAAARHLNGARRAGLQGDRLVEAFRDQVGGGVALEAADFRGLNVRAGARGGQDEDADSVWDSLVGTFHAGKLPPAGSAAKEMNRLAGSDESDEIEDWEACIVNLLEAARSGEHGDRDDAVNWLTDFFLQLNPQMRQQLLTILPMHLEESGLLIERLADLLPVSEIVESLKAATGKPSPAAIRLLRTLAHAGTSVTPAGGESDDDTDNLDSDISHRLARLFDEDASEEFCPEDYSRLLEELTFESVRPDFSPEQWPYSDPSDRTLNALHTLEIAGAILAAPPADGLPVECCFAEATQNARLALERRRLDLLDPMYRAAKTDHARLPEARRFVGALADDQIIHHVARAAFTDNEAPATDSPIVNDLAEKIALSLLDRADGRLGEQQRQFVVNGLAQMAPERAMKRIADIGPGTLSEIPEVLGFLKQVPANQALSLLRPFLGAERDRTRGYAFEVVRARFVVWPRDLILLGLVDPHQPIRRLAADHLKTWVIDDRIDLLETLAASGDHDQHEEVWRLLADCGDGGLERLCRLRSGRSSTDGALRTELDRFLEGYGDHPIVARASARRSWPFVGMITRLLNRG